MQSRRSSQRWPGTTRHASGDCDKSWANTFHRICSRSFSGALSKHHVKTTKTPRRAKEKKIYALFVTINIYISMYLASGAPVPAASMIRYVINAARDWLVPYTPPRLPNYTVYPRLIKGRTDVRKETRCEAARMLKN